MPAPLKYLVETAGDNGRRFFIEVEPGNVAMLADRIQRALEFDLTGNPFINLSTLKGEDSDPQLILRSSAQALLTALRAELHGRIQKQEEGTRRRPVIRVVSGGRASNTKVLLVRGTEEIEISGVTAVMSTIDVHTGVSKVNLSLVGAEVDAIGELADFIKGRHRTSEGPGDGDEIMFGFNDGVGD